MRATRHPINAPYTQGVPTSTPLVASMMNMGNGKGIVSNCFSFFSFSSPSSSFFLILEYSDCIVDEVVLCEKFEKTTLTQRFVVKEYMKLSFLNYNLLRSFLFLRKENF